MADPPPPRTLTAADIGDDMLGGLIRAFACADMAQREHRWPTLIRWPRWSTPAMRYAAVDRARDMISTAAAQQRRRRRAPR